MSSTTDRPAQSRPRDSVGPSARSRERGAEAGQVLVMFAGGLFTLVIVAAFAFDTGMMLLERRDQQNAADAAALAGARYLVGTPAQSPVDAAESVATANGFTNGVDSETVTVNVPPAHGQFKGNNGFIEVEISSTRPSIFAWVMGILGWDVSARAVAANQQGVALPYSMLALNTDYCSAFLVSGSGVVESNGSIQVNSDCADAALKTSGLGNLTVTAKNSYCNVVGGITETGNSTLNCVQQANSYSVDDPLLDLAAPPVPAFPASVVSLSGRSIPNGCPGSASPATAADPATCSFNANGAAWRLYPGYYPGGLDLGGSTSNPGIYYLEPGIYYVGGGGFRAAGARVWSVDAGTTTYGGGIMIYNDIDPAYLAECSQTPEVPPVNLDGLGRPLLPNASYPDGTIVYDVTAKRLYQNVADAWVAYPGMWPCTGAVQLNGGTAGIKLMPLDDGSDWDGLVIFSNRYYQIGEHFWCGTVPSGYPAVSGCESNYEITINGGDSDMEIRGTVYAPGGDIRVNGNAGTLTLDQLIASTVKINGNGGTVKIQYEYGAVAKLRGVGLVE